MPLIPDPYDDETARKNKDLHETYEKYLDSWTNIIK